MCLFPTPAPECEQDICVDCGFCCDGTLFLQACLQPGERGSLPGRIEAASYSLAGEDFFRLPCNYFSEKCIIYDKPRAFVCGSYRCQLLKDMTDGRVSHDEARNIVSQAMMLRDRIINSFQQMTGDTSAVPFRKLLAEMGSLRQRKSIMELSDADYDMFVAGCNILEALLIKHFMSADEFGKMMI